MSAVSLSEWNRFLEFAKLLVEGENDPYVGASRVMLSRTARED